MKNSTEYMREYMRINRKKYSKNFAVKHDCEICGGVYRINTKTRHCRSKKHMNAIRI